MSENVSDCAKPHKSSQPRVGGVYSTKCRWSIELNTILGDHQAVYVKYRYK